ncbi:MAG: PAS domain-containing protein [Desulfobacteraceae bacterium]|nr:PAS domain-containing protein [Desulfobacteraceae bacterium]
MRSGLTKKQMVTIIRLLVIITIAYVIIFTPARGASRYPGYAFIAFYFFTNLLIYRVPDRYFDSGRIFYFFVFFDTLLIACGIYVAGLVGTDLYLVYFLIICLASLGAQFRYLMINVMVFTGLYGWFLYQNNYLSGEMAVSYLLRLPFMIVVAMFYGFIVSAALRDREQRIHEEQERSRQLFESSDVFAYTVGLSGEYLSANPKLYEAYGFNDEVSMLGLPFSKFHQPEETTEFQEHVNKVFEGGKPVQFESYDLRLGQWLSHTLSPIFDRSQQRVFAVGVVSKDITERVKKEDELRRAYDKLRETRDQLIQKDKMAALGRLASGIAHEIRNPLEIISMGLDYLENIVPKEDNSAAEKSIERIYSAIDRANSIIDEVLKFSRKTEFVIEPVDVCALTEEVLSLAAHRIKKTGVKVVRKYETDSLKVAGNRNMLSQVLLNLVDNAVGAMEDSTIKELHISIYTKKVTEVGYKTGYRRADYFKMNEEMTVVEITDTGNGIAEEVLPKIFEPFFTTKAAGEGTGLGLSLAHMIMDRMMGTIDVTSRVGFGTTFYVKMQPESKTEMIREAGYEQGEEKGPGY